MSIYGRELVNYYRDRVRSPHFMARRNGLPIALIPLHPSCKRNWGVYMRSSNMTHVRAKLCCTWGASYRFCNFLRQPTCTHELPVIFQQDLEIAALHALNFHTQKFIHELLNPIRLHTSTWIYNTNRPSTPSIRSESDYVCIDVWAFKMLPKR